MRGKTTAFLMVVIISLAIPSTGLTQTSLSVEDLNERLRQEYWRDFKHQVERQRYLKGRGASRVTEAQHFRVKCWEDGKLRVDEESVFLTGLSVGVLTVMLSDGRLMFIHDSSGLCVVEEQAGPSLP